MGRCGSGYAFLSFAFFGGYGVVVGAAGGTCGAVTHSVCYSDINKKLPVVDGGDDLHEFCHLVDKCRAVGIRDRQLHASS